MVWHPEIALFLLTDEPDNFVDIEAEKKGVIQLISAGNELPDVSVEGVRCPLEGRFIDGDNLIDRVNLEADDGVNTGSDNDIHQRVFIFSAREVEPASKVDGGNDLSPKVEETACSGWGHWYAGDRLGPKNLLNSVDLNPEEESFQQECAVLLVIVEKVITCIVRFVIRHSESFSDLGGQAKRP